MSNRLLSLPLAGAAVLAVAAPAPAAVVDCRAKVDYNLVVSSARNLSCGAAARDLARYKGSISTRLTTPGGYACGRVSGGRLGGTWRCTRGAKAYRFRFAD